jgi:hypothetical protein
MEPKSDIEIHQIKELAFNKNLFILIARDGDRLQKQLLGSADFNLK